MPVDKQTHDDVSDSDDTSDEVDYCLNNRGPTRLGSQKLNVSVKCPGCAENFDNNTGLVAN